MNIQTVVGMPVKAKYQQDILPKSKKLLHTKGPINKTKRQPAEWEKIFGKFLGLDYLILIVGYDI